MKARCEDSTNQDYKYYGAKGITVCDEWRTYQRFAIWSFKNGYEDTLSIERNDNSKNYSPDNCRWITFGQQALNRESNYEIDGKNLKDYCAERNLNYKAILNRIWRGWSLVRAINQPISETRGGNRRV